MRIAFLTGSFSAYSGIERQVQYQAEEYVTAGHDVSVFTFEADMQPTARYSLQILGMPQNLLFHRIARLLYPMLFWVVRRHLRYVRDFDLVIAHQYPLTVLAAKAKKTYGARFTYFDHGVPPPSVFAGVFDRIYIWIFSKMMVASIRQADRVVCISKYLQTEMKKLTGITAEVQYDTYDHSRFHHGVDSTTVRKQLHLGSRPVILFIGRISPHKNIESLIRAFRLVDASLHAVLVIVGKKTFRAYAKKLDRLANDDVIFAGYIPDENIPGYYGAATVYATTSLWEGFDLPIVEARACGVPSVMFEIGPHPEISTSGDILVPVGNITRFAKALEVQIKNRTFSANK